MAKAKARSIYDVHPGVAMMVKWVAELKEKTGRSVYIVGTDRWGSEEVAEDGLRSG